MKISVIMGVYNPPAKYQLFQAVMSMINQSFTEWELILYDDGSTARYAEMIEEAANLDKRIMYIRNEQNHGLAYALNRCIELSGGTYIARMDADDFSHPQRLQTLYDFLEHNPEYQWVGSNAELFDDEGTWGIEKMPEIPVAGDFLKYSPYIHPSVMFRKEILLELGGYTVSEATRRCEDYELFMRLHKEGYHGYNLQQNLLRYREDESAYNKRKYKYYIREIKIRFSGFKNLEILSIKTMPYVLKPLVVGLVIPPIQRYIKKGIRKEYYVEWQRKS